MALVVGELYEALKLAQIPDDQARAATAVADFERRIGRIETLVSVDAAVLAMNTDPRHRRRRASVPALLNPVLDVTQTRPPSQP